MNHTQQRRGKLNERRGGEKEGRAGEGKKMTKNRITPAMHCHLAQTHRRNRERKRDHHRTSQGSGEEKGERVVLLRRTVQPSLTSKSTSRALYLHSEPQPARTIQKRGLRRKGSNPSIRRKTIALRKCWKERRVDGGKPFGGLSHSYPQAVGSLGTKGLGGSCKDEVATRRESVLGPILKPS